MKSLSAARLFATANPRKPRRFADENSTSTERESLPGESDESTSVRSSHAWRESDAAVGALCDREVTPTDLMLLKTQLDRRYNELEVAAVDSVTLVRVLEGQADTIVARCKRIERSATEAGKISRQISNSASELVEIAEKLEMESRSAAQSIRATRDAMLRMSGQGFGIIHVMLGWLAKIGSMIPGMNKREREKKVMFAPQ